MTGGAIPVAGSNGIIGYHNIASPISPCITIGRSGNVGTPYMYEKAWAHNTTLYIDEFKGNDPLYIYYLLKTLPLSSFGGGSAVPTLNRNHIHPLIVKHCKNVSKQKEIASVLRTFDDKIELNNRINHNLEQQAQALYKSWFVDFEPFRDGKFVDSELGLIPEGWRVGVLSDICDIISGATPSKSKSIYYTSSGIAWITPKDLSISCRKFTSKGADDITDAGYRSCSTKLMPRGTVLFSSRAPIGYLTIAKNEICTNQGFKSAVPGIAGTAFLYYFLRDNTELIKSKASGSTFKEASSSLMKSLSAIIPPKDVLDSFESTLKPILDKQELCEEEIMHFESIRDSILPKLMSGELKINDLTC